MANFSTISEIEVHDYLAGRYILKNLFVSLFKHAIKSSDVSIAIRDKKPQISFNNTIYYCSISHSKNFVACSISVWNQIGVDIEELTPRSKELQNYIANAEELHYFGVNEEFLSTRVWSIKEAAYKSDCDQRLITNYTITGKNEGCFSVNNVRTGKTIRVKNQVIDNYTVSYTIPSTI